MDESRLEKLEQRMEELDRRSMSMERAMEKAMDRSRAAMNSVLPSETRRHLRAAGREQLLAVRSLLDYWVDRMTEKSDKDNGSGGGRENIQID